MKKSKYNSKKITVNGINFDSKDEALYYEYLLKRFEGGHIKSFELQPQYVLLDKFVKLGVSYRAITYTPDFKIYHNDGTIELIDVKGMSTQQGNLRRKMFDARYPEKLTWVTRNLKYGDADGWIEYDELARKRRESKKLKEME